MRSSPTMTVLGLLVSSALGDVSLSSRSGSEIGPGPAPINALDFKTLQRHPHADPSKNHAPILPRGIDYDSIYDGLPADEKKIVNDSVAMAEDDAPKAADYFIKQNENETTQMTAEDSENLYKSAIGGTQQLKEAMLDVYAEDSGTA